jgi:hypothetical protein
MGMDQVVTFTAERAPSWPAVRDLLGSCGLQPQLRMIDGQLAFPDEEPGDGWQELRVGTAQGMVTLRREPEGVRVVTWGNADSAMREAWNAVAWAIAVLSDGTVQTGSVNCQADEFARTAELPAAIRSHR